MREYVTPIFLASAINLFAQFPPIALEWSALRWYDGYPNAHISRDPVLGGYVWAVYNNFQGASDEVAFPFLPDGTDMAPLFPERFNVGSLDRLIDLQVNNGNAYNLISHLSLAGAPYWWHLNTAPEGTGYFVTNPGAAIDPALSEFGYDLLVTNSAAYGCGSSQTSVFPDSSVGRVLKTDLLGDLIWNAIWDDTSSVTTAFTGLAIKGDTVMAIALPYAVLFDDATGGPLDTIEIAQVAGAARCTVMGDRIYWAAASASGLQIGYHDLNTGLGATSSVATDATSNAHLVFDQFDHLWVTETITGGTDWTIDDDLGRWYRFDEQLQQIDSGSLNSGIDDMCFMNSKISFTGVFDPSSAIAYLITGTPQP